MATIKLLFGILYSPTKPKPDNSMCLRNMIMYILQCHSPTTTSVVPLIYHANNFVQKIDVPGLDTTKRSIHIN